MTDVSATVVRDDERYKVVDFDLGDKTVSITFLHPRQCTRGHTHPHKETYTLVEGSGIVVVGHDALRFNRTNAESIQVEPDDFHQVFNVSDKELVFMSIFDGARGDAKYAKERSPGKA